MPIEALHAKRDSWDDDLATRDFAGVDDAAASSDSVIKATPYACRDARSIPLRPWLYGRQFLRGSLSVIVAPGAVGKTSLLIGSALAMVSGRSLLGKTVWGGAKSVWLWNLEDSRDEL